MKKILLTLPFACTFAFAGDIEPTVTTYTHLGYDNRDNGAFIEDRSAQLTFSNYLSSDEIIKKRRSKRSPGCAAIRVRHGIWQMYNKCSRPVSLSVEFQHPSDRFIGYSYNIGCAPAYAVYNTGLTSSYPNKYYSSANPAGRC